MREISCWGCGSNGSGVPEVQKLRRWLRRNAVRVVHFVAKVVAGGQSDSGSFRSSMEASGDSRQPSRRNSQCVWSGRSHRERVGPERKRAIRRSLTCKGAGLVVVISGRGLGKYSGVNRARISCYRHPSGYTRHSYEARICMTLARTSILVRPKTSLSQYGQFPRTRFGPTVARLVVGRAVIANYRLARS
jgi:hypothetical protein